jgi:hypothetical protein
MANIKVAYTTIGPIIGDFDTENTSKGIVYKVTNPMLLQQMGQQLGIVPVLGFTKSKVLSLPEADVHYNRELFEPQDELRNHWNSQFGSGLILSTAPASISKK